ncbi:AbgT family transporter [Haliea sp. E1-2-M8]|uniref:AbgT family transporter n=1 Tax=Haliea sp. E1-2-M8 TaxID=3064706 RepID=UPI002721E218|nr:AbgT family transporter [Haliea sp. E1-2-M8]MDO8864190.1 AbgT family transporter [Haliea sp. E1-2-M8]
MAEEPPHQHDTQPPAGWFTRFLNTVEWLGNLLPHPVTLFACFTIGIVLLSGFAA